jgi:hypothetical protein
MAENVREQKTLANAIGLTKSAIGDCVDKAPHDAIREKLWQLVDMLHDITARDAEREQLAAEAALEKAADWLEDRISKATAEYMRESLLPDAGKLLAERERQARLEEAREILQESTGETGATIRRKLIARIDRLAALRKEE